MTEEELDKIRFQVWLKMAEKLLENADYSRGDELLTEEQREVCMQLESLYYSGELTYREVHNIMCPKHKR